MGNSSIQNTIIRNLNLSVLHMILIFCTEEHGKVWMWLKSARLKSLHKIDICRQTATGRNALHYAAFRFIPNHSTFIFEILLEDWKDNTKIKDIAKTMIDQNGRTPLHLFFQNVNVQSVIGTGELTAIIELLCDSKKRVLDIECDGGTPLHIAISTMELPVRESYTNSLKVL